MAKQEIEDKLKLLKTVVKARTPILAISAKTKQGIPELLSKLKELVVKQRSKAEKAAKPEIPVIKLESEDGWSIEKLEAGYAITGRRIERFADRTDFDNQAGIQRLRDIMRKMGIAHELERKGIEQGHTIRIGDHKLKW
jgi:GTP-binding protein